MPWPMAGAPSAEIASRTEPLDARAGRRGWAGRARAVCQTTLVSLLMVSCGGSDEPTPSLLLVTVDALRADRLACYGGPADAGTSICALADQGSLFLWALAPSSSGGPSAASLLTSRLPSDHGLGESAASFLRSEVTSVAESLRSAGHRTAAFVSSPELTRSRNIDQGFEVFDDRLERDETGPPARSARATVDTALAWIAKAESPWFVWVHLGDLHGPYPPPPISSYEEYAERQATRLARIDTGVGRLLEAVIDGRGAVEVVFAGLHGETRGERGRWYRHGVSLGLEQVRVPLLWRGAGFGPGGVRVVAAVSLLDVAPALLRAVGRTAGDASEGVALPRPGDPPALGGSRPIYTEHSDEVGVASGGYYYVRDRRGRPGSGRIVPLSESGELRAPMAAVGPGLATRAETLETRLAERWPPPAAPEPSDPSDPSKIEAAPPPAPGTGLPAAPESEPPHSP